MRTAKIMLAGVTLAITALTLTACVGGTTVDDTKNGGKKTTVSTFDSPPKLTVMPIWNLDGLRGGMFNGVVDESVVEGDGDTSSNDPDSSKQVDPDNLPPTEDPNSPEYGQPSNEVSPLPPTDTLLVDYIFLENSETKCSVEGRISATDGYLLNRGDKFNSETEFYSDLFSSLPAPTEAGKTVTINNMEFFQADYQSPAELGGNTFHKKAVRVIGSPVAVPEGTLPSSDNFQSDPLQGLPVVTIDYSCPSADLFDEAAFEKVQKDAFKLVLK